MESYVNVGACVSVANLQMTVFSFILSVCLVFISFIFYSAQFSASKVSFPVSKVSFPVSKLSFPVRS